MRDCAGTGYSSAVTSMHKQPRMIAAAAAVLIAIAVAAIFGVRNYQADKRAQQEAAARVASAIVLVRSRLPDPKSAEFRDISARQTVVCGEVNFREGNTASGYRWFMAGPGAPDGFWLDRPGTPRAEGYCATLPRLFPAKP